MFYALILATLPYVVTDLLPSVDTMEAHNKKYTSLLDKNLNQFILASEEHRYDDAYDAWYIACNSFFSLQCFYFQTLGLTPNYFTKIRKGYYLWKFRNSFRKELQDSRIIEAFVANGLAAEHLSPSQRYITEKILNNSSYSAEKSLHALRSQERHNYVYSAKASPTTIRNRLRILTANILCFPNPLSYFFGGLSPWPDRIQGIADKILSTKANIVCLQEVWERPVAEALIERLKEHYSYFIYDVGNQYDSLSPTELGFSSGLFIASDVPLGNISFTPFNRRLPSKSGVQRGALKATFSAGNQEWTLVATHLHHGNNETDIRLRQDQLKTCITLLGNKRGCILGDLNINAFSEEFQESPLTKDFFVPYLRGKTMIDPSIATATDYFNDLAHTRPSERSTIQPTYELIDYCAVPKNHTTNLLSQERVPFFSIQEPTAALSDHHGILTTWSVP